MNIPESGMVVPMSRMKNVALITENCHELTQKNDQYVTFRVSCTTCVEHYDSVKNIWKKLNKKNVFE